MKNKRLNELVLSSNKNINDLTYLEIIKYLQENDEIKKNLPSRLIAKDPRNFNQVVYSEARAFRPCNSFDETLNEENCPICEGKTTRILDVAKLSEGHTFINLNLYPILYPFKNEQLNETSYYEKMYGTHFLHWHSTDHQKDFHNMEIEDIKICFERIADLEKFLLTSESHISFSDNNKRGHITIIKNYRRGGSLAHGHIQIFHASSLSKAEIADREFLKKYGYGFSSLLQNEKTSEITFSYNKNEVVVITPFCIRRPLECTICFKDCTKNYLHQLSEQELYGLSQVFSHVTKSIFKIMPDNFGLKPSYTILFHLGEIGGLYIEILPHTQELGACEYLGFYVCDGTAKYSTELYKKAKL